MKLKDIALVGVVLLLVVGSLGGIAVAGAEGRGSGGEFRQEQGWRFDACYWWEVPPVTPYEREQIREIMTLVIRRYFGIDISAMSPREFEEVGESLGPAKEWEALRLFGYYAQKKGVEVPAGVFDAPPGFDQPPGISARVETPPERHRAYRTAGEVYWWEVVANPDEEVKEIMQEIAKVKGISPAEVEERFGELFPGVELWEMSLAEFCYFVGNLPQPPLRTVCLEEEKQKPYVIAVFGRVPELLTEREIKEFDEKLRRVIHAVPSSVWRDLICSSSGGTVTAHGANRGAIDIWVSDRDFAAADEIYEIISEKAKTLFGIKDVPVVFSGGITLGPTTTTATWPPPPPYGAPYRPIPGGVAIQSSGGGTATSGFAVIQRRTVWSDDRDYVTTGHLAGVNTRIYQPAIGRGNEAGHIIARPGRRARADVARVGIADAHVHPRIHVGHGVQRPVSHGGDPGINERVWMSGAASGRSVGGRVTKYMNFDIGPGHLLHPWYDFLYHQIVVSGIIPKPADSGAPLYMGVRIIYPYCVAVHGITVGKLSKNGVPFGGAFSPISGILHELPGVEVWRAR